MRLIKRVSLRPPLHAAAAVIRSRSPSAAPDAFSQWWRDSGVVHRAVLAAPDLQALLPTAPRTELGTAWVTAAQEALDLALADAWRPFDEAEYDTAAELAALADLEVLADRVEARSPLLTGVAEELRRQGTTSRFSLDMADRRRIEGAGVRIGGDPDDDSHPGGGHEWQRVAAWSDIELLAPDVRTRLQAIFGTLDAELPALADDDGGAARGHRRNE